MIKFFIVKSVEYDENDEELSLRQAIRKYLGSRANFSIHYVK